MKIILLALVLCTGCTVNHRTGVVTWHTFGGAPGDTERSSKAHELLNDMDGFNRPRYADSFSPCNQVDQTPAFPTQQQKAEALAKREAHQRAKAEGLSP